MGRVYQLTYPDGEVLTYSYGPLGGLLSQISTSLAPATLVSGVQYNALGLPASYVLGSGTTAEMRHSYYGPDASSPYGALKMIQLQKGADVPLVNRDISYDFAGNVAGITDYVNAEYVGYTYDELDRLGWATAPAGEGFGYKQIGNIVSKAGVPLVYGDAAHKHAVTSYNGTTYVYDANGCMVTRGSQAIKYDPESRPVRVDGGGTVHYVGSHYERNVGTGQDTTQTVTKYYYATLGAASRLIGLRRQGTFYYVCTDRLGSTVKVVTEDGTGAVSSLWYHAFGADRGSADSLGVDKRYTGQTVDQSIGLYFYQSRYYDPELGRFVSPDTIVPDYKNPQALNRYSYTGNNPLRYTDPTGHRWEEDAGEDSWYYSYEYYEAEQYYYWYSVATATATPTATPEPMYTPTPEPVYTPTLVLSATPTPTPAHTKSRVSAWSRSRDQSQPF